MERRFFDRDSIRLSYLENGGEGPVIIALHAMWMQAVSYEKVADRFGVGYRFFALDLRGHGHSASSQNYSPDEYVEDLRGFINHLRIEEPVILMGNSLGGIVAFMFAAKYPALVKSMVIEESPAEEKSDMKFMLEWDGLFPKRQDLERKIGSRLAWSLIPSMIQTEKGWRLSFDMKDMMEISRCFNGNRWSQWMQSNCPALLFRGLESRAVNGAVLKEMAEKRPNTKYIELHAGHVIHEDYLTGFYNEVTDFIR